MLIGSGGQCQTVPPQRSNPTTAFLGLPLSTRKPHVGVLLPSQKPKPGTGAATSCTDLDALGPVPCEHNRVQLRGSTAPLTLIGVALTMFAWLRCNQCVYLAKPSMANKARRLSISYCRDWRLICRHSFLESVSVPQQFIRVPRLGDFVIHEGLRRRDVRCPDCNQSVPFRSMQRS